MTVSRPATLAEHTAKILRKQIAAGDFGDILPGEPRLAGHLQVSRGTLRKALRMLADQGVLAPVETGKPRRVLVRARTGARRRAPYRVNLLALRAVEDLPITTQHLLRHLEEETGLDGVVYAFHHSAATQLKRPARRLRSLLAESPADLWLLYEATIPVARFFKSSGIPAIVCGGPALDEGLSYCGFDGATALRHAINLFYRAGHTKIIMPSRYRRRVREQTFREECKKKSIPFQPSVHMPLWNNDLNQLRRLLNRRLAAPDRPTACILSTLEALIVLYSCLMEHGMAVPKDMSVLTIGSDPMLQCFSPPISYYQTPFRQLARALASMIRLHVQAPVLKPEVRILQTEYVSGGSVGPAPPGN